jgi:hypothetical protein
VLFFCSFIIAHAMHTYFENTGSLILMMMRPPRVEQHLFGSGARHCLFNTVCSTPRARHHLLNTVCSPPSASTHCLSTQPVPPSRCPTAAAQAHLLNTKCQAPLHGTVCSAGFLLDHMI